MMSLGPGAAANKKAALEQLKFKKKQKQQNTSVDESVLPASASWTAAGTTLDRPPAQSRDATIPSRYFSATPISPGNVLAPNSSPPPHDPSHHSNRSFWQSDSLGDGIPGLIHSEPPSQPFTPVRVDPLTAPSGFVRGNSVPHASFTRPWNGNGRQMSETEDSGDGERPRKRINRGRSPKDPLDLLTSPESPEVQAPGRKRRVNGTFSLSSISSDESISDAMDVAGPSRSRIVRHAQSPQEPPSSSQPSQSESEDPRFTRFKMVQPLHPLSVVRAAWDQAGGDVQKASALLTDPSWRPPSASNGKPVARPTAETGRVKEIDEANKAQRAAIRERGKQSMIYKSRPALDGKPPSKPGPSTPSLAAADLEPPQTPGSPVVSQARVKRLKRKVIDSESEAESVDSDASARVARPKEDSRHELRVLNYFNTAAAEGLQEITGCTVEQANKIIELRPFSSVADLRARLSQGKKKAGPAGISPRMFEDCVAIFEGYGRVDSILQDCEEIGAELKAEIASWTKHSRSRDPSLGVENTNPTDGTLSLHDQADLTDSKPSYYLTSQPSLLEEGVQLKEYQMIGINWLNLLYRRKLSCILADEMGLGKTIQVISFFAHLKEKGRHGPHLVVVPSSTLENWCREFDRFASNMSVNTYYGGKEERPALRQSLLETRYNNKTGEGWEVLITTYNLAQGDEKDRKFFRKIEWDACVFDEGHVLKNFQSQRYQTLLRYESRWRLLLTGTPLQNNLQELVSLMNFILPQQFAADLDSLRAVFKTKGDSKVTLLAQERVSRAKKMLTPFVLRRRKDQVLKDLPKKNERIEWCDMTPLQRSIYNEALQRSRKTIFDVDAQAAEIVDEPKPAKRTRANTRPKDKLYVENSSNVLMDLRKAASHPMLFRRRFTDDTLTRVAKLLLKEPDFKRRKAVFQYIKEDLEVMTDAELQEYCASYNSTRKFLQAESCYLEAGKVKVLMQLLDKYQAAGRRVLIFSQFTQILDILQKVLQQKSIKYLLLTGSTPVDNRQSLVDDFHTDESITVFLLSTKAGGMGINLTAASVVIMFDQDFNPHNDKQAQDRAYRIGQKQDVDVVKLITKGSIEEDMLALGQTKLALDEAVAGEEGEEEKVERDMKTSLMNVVRKKLQETQDEDVPMPDAEPIDDDIGSPLSVLDDT
ncbi:uncharacterized protein LAESUDRAFT_361822 [Laetiporus sulphureus 93-53]|uniref:DNA helicase n=1 Tax=Laetiporus sulphureus 93-53 TaxID=1314785 RepID=A0A165GZ82_9APHY|nr:uncharacterized protein LAESUDRAFT_361822 [Laetiporus sulphureus 93-53]KZT11032.1 hypothetical protein LAESUDRAFT_361822 [Laetiporus sulphureus 93-53]